MEIPDPYPATEPPTDGKFVMYYEKSYGWWQDKYMPDDQVAGYQPNAWDLIGLYGTQGEITHWMPMPPAPALPALVDAAPA
jgi:hypothetical protein